MNLYNKDQQTIAAVDEVAPSETDVFQDEFKRKKFHHLKAYLNATGSESGFCRVRQRHLVLWHIAPMRTPRMKLEDQLHRGWKDWIYTVTKDFLKNEGLKCEDEVDSVTTTNRAPVSMFEARDHEYPILFEKRSGTITEKLGDQIEVAYDLPDGPVKQIYRLGQLKGEKLPNEGDMVEARLSLVVVDRPERNDADLESPLPSFEDIESPKEVSI